MYIFVCYILWPVPQRSTVCGKSLHTCVCTCTPNICLLAARSYVRRSVRRFIQLVRLWKTKHSIRFVFNFMSYSSLYLFSCVVLSQLWGRTNYSRKEDCFPEYIRESGSDWCLNYSWLVGLQTSPPCDMYDFIQMENITIWQVAISSSCSETILVDTAVRIYEYQQTYLQLSNRRHVQIGTLTLDRLA